jgi:hypothetical protein
MAAPGLELLAGVVQDQVFGQLVLFGLYLRRLREPLPVR